MARLPLILAILALIFTVISIFTLLPQYVGVLCLCGAVLFGESPNSRP